MLIFSNAKINIGLNIYDKNPDGYHNIESIFYPIYWQDTIEIILKKSTNKITYYNYGLQVDGNSDDNLIVKAYRLLKQTYQLCGADIHHLKNVPMGAGLGGGSANAAYTLQLVNKIFELGLSNNELKNYAAQLGSDCVFFIDNKPAYVFGRGDTVNTINLDLGSFYCVIVKPPFHVSTREAYQYANKRGIKTNTVRLSDFISKPLQEWKHYFTNDFEDFVFERHPYVKTIKEKLYQFGALYASMSGSGTAVYGIFNQPVNLKKEFLGQSFYAGYFNPNHIYQTGIKQFS